MKEKPCRECKRSLALSCFKPSNVTEDGLMHMCADCFEARIQAKHEERRQKLLKARSQRQDELLTQVCVACGVEKEIELFRRLAGGSYVDRISRCIDCERFARRQKARLKAEEERNKRIEASLAMAWEDRKEQRDAMYRDRAYKRNYGIDLDRYNTMHKEQGGICAICGSPYSPGNKPLVVDHSHVTGAVRGLLCSFCNMGLGFFKDDVGSLLRAAEYLRESRWEE